MPFFNLLHQDKNSRARTGIIHTDHGDIETPAFMPVGTQASVKTLDSFDLEKINAQIILANTYHLHLRPGEDLVAELGGLHKFMNWSKPILTDSGGFQVFSLGLQKKISSRYPSRRYVGTDSRMPKSISGKSGLSGNPDTTNSQARLVKIDKDGVTFQSHIDGSVHRFTPESAIEIQHKLGADIIMAFDECTPDDAPKEYAREAMERTHRWAQRSLEQHNKLQQNVRTAKIAKPTNDTPISHFRMLSHFAHKQYLFGIIQGAGHRDLREESAKYISSLDFDGIAIGGESIGYNMEATADILDWVYPILPKDKPRYAMGVGLSPLDLLIAVAHGADMFDCVAPTRLARHGSVFVSNPRNPRINLFKSVYKKDTSPIDEKCLCSTCQNYSRAYLHHLFVAEELSALRLASIHNLHFLLNLMAETREAILNDKFIEFKQHYS